MRPALPILLLTFACGESTRFVAFGDNLSTSPTFRSSWVGLLEQNDDAVFPSFAGRSLTDRFDDVEVVRLARGGNSFRSSARSKEPFCTCTEDCPPDCLDASSDDPTKLIIQLGSNDLIGMLIRIVQSESPLEDELEIFRSDVRGVLSLSADRARFKTAPEVLVTNIYDPTDGIGDVLDLAAPQIPPGLGVDLSALTPELMLAVIGGGNRVISEEAAAIGARVIDIHGHFLGHGHHSDDADLPNYRADDPTRWMRGIFDPSLRGAHELRRLLWRAIANEDIDEIPMNLPPDSTLGLPAVPDNGWAKATVSANITKEIYSAASDLTFENANQDTRVIVGPPDGFAGIVALGVIGAFIVGDLGENTVATDGEGADLVVIELGPLSGGVPEPYRVSVSNSPTGPFSVIGDASGETAFDLREVGLTRARYVKIESLASEVDILNGLGSPIAPGPEIDAIGAVYPGSL